MFFSYRTSRSWNQSSHITHDTDRSFCRRWPCSQPRQNQQACPQQILDPTRKKLSDPPNPRATRTRSHLQSRLPPLPFSRASLILAIRASSPLMLLEIARRASPQSRLPPGDVLSPPPDLPTQQSHRSLRENRVRERCARAVRANA